MAPAGSDSQFPNPKSQFPIPISQVPAPAIADKDISLFPRLPGCVFPADNGNGFGMEEFNFTERCLILAFIPCLETPGMSSSIEIRGREGEKMRKMSEFRVGARDDPGQGKKKWEFLDLNFPVLIQQPGGNGTFPGNQKGRSREKCRGQERG